MPSLKLFHIISHRNASLTKLQEFSCQPIFVVSCEILPIEHFFKFIKFNFARFTAKRAPSHQILALSRNMKMAHLTLFASANCMESKIFSNDQIHSSPTMGLVVQLNSVGPNFLKCLKIGLVADESVPIIFSGPQQLLNLFPLNSTFFLQERCKSGQ